MSLPGAKRKERKSMNQTNPITIIEASLARCVTEPRGSHGLEGYGLGQSYRFERCEDGKGRYCRIYPDGDFPSYYETCGEGVFAGYFEPIGPRSVTNKQAN
jgi:hypothetical protein